MKPVSWTQNAVVLLSPGTKTRTMKEGQAAQVFLWLEKQMLFFISLQFYIHVLHALPTWVKLPFPSSPTPVAFPYEPVWGQYQSVRQTLKIPKKKKNQKLVFQTSLQHIWSLPHYELQLLIKCLFKRNFPGNVKDNINNDHELGWMNGFAEVHCSLNI